jgi:hypothetical protein
MIMKRYRRRWSWEVRGPSRTEHVGQVCGPEVVDADDLDVEVWHGAEGHATDTTETADADLSMDDS